MSQLEKNQQSFRWGSRMDAATDDTGMKLYRSFTYQGVQYARFDCICLYREGATETDIGKLVKIWETKKGGKRGKVLWFFRPLDVYNYLGDYRPAWNELFLASGRGTGVFNIIPLEAIIGKCKVLCTSKDSRNPMASKSHLEKAYYFFSHVFNVEDLRISAKLPDRIESIKVEHLFNWNRDKPEANVECRTVVTALTGGARLKDVEKSTHSPEKPLKVECPSTYDDVGYHTSEGQPLKKRKILLVPERDSLPSSQDAGRWFCKLPWEERVKEAHEHGTLVHLVNLDPSHTALDVEDILSSAFKIKAEAKIMPHRHFFNSWYGEALVIFKSKDDANLVIYELNKKCLMVGEGRPLIACSSNLIAPNRTCNFPGHLVMDSLLKLKSNKRKAVYTSHCAQANTIEHEMAMQWRVLQKKSDLWWEALIKNQEKEMSPYLAMMKSRESVEVELRAAEEAHS